MSTCRERISLAHALGARKIFRPYLSPTPLRQYASLNRHFGAKVYVKHENHNPTGTAYNVPFSLYRDALTDFVLLTEAELYQGIALAAHHTRNLTEGAGSACLRAAFKIRERLSGKKVAIQMNGGNASGVELQTAMGLPCLLDGVC